METVSFLAIIITILLALIPLQSVHAKAGGGKKIAINRQIGRDKESGGGGGKAGGSSQETSLDYGDHNYTDYNSTEITYGNTRLKSPEERLLYDLFRFYTPDARAGLDSAMTVTVETQYTLLRVRGLDERTQVLTTTGLVITEWTDLRLQWNPADYENLSDLVVPPHMIWLPELALMNGAEHLAHDFDRMGVYIEHNGKVHWEPGGIFSTTCDIDITYFPFDKQSCPIIVGAWAYYSRRMNLTNSTSKISLHDFTENGEWEIEDTLVTWGETALPQFDDVRFAYVTSTLYLKRRIYYYFVNVMIPCFMLSVLVLVVFWIPPEAGEKVSCGISVILAFTVFLLMVSESVPKTSLQMPVLSIYLTTTMLLGATSLSMSIMVLNVHHGTRQQNVPRWIQVIILSLMAGILCMRTGSIKQHMRNRQKRREAEKLQREAEKETSTLSEVCAESEHQDSKTDSPIPKTLSERRLSYSFEEPDWRDVSRVLDRMFFVLVLMAMFVSSALTLCAPYYASS